LTEAQPLWFKIVGWVAFFTAVIMTTLVRMSYFPLTFWRAMEAHNITNGKRELYLVSTEDKMCDLEKLRELIEYRRKHRVKSITSMIWDGPGHCDHLIRRPEEYTRYLQDFVSAVKGETD